ncbi:pyruvate kinase alpha/beta domain-containing protein [Pseudothermotoga thermarum]|uniref:Pyruvate kinase C-terminal domain-containing protein n=1 Tax=Pseudothermotoga thermarum DSM 5069 TaxID=688269 RepID=F7YYM3_9THEM|nr:pyruvate kinase alpha/beta domain-containing protein [Pseudothermotoga thermarum]AEH51055.1 hypothetical protein Theth_0972 [Pseudothermotoga thermarum DSM 5069]
MVLFKEAGEHNTEETLKLAIEEARKFGKKLLIASTTGKSAKKALEMIPDDFQLIVVTHHTGFKQVDEQEFPEEVRNLLLQKGHKVLTATHVLSGIERAFRREYQGIHLAEIVANTLRLFSQGMKVCVEIALMAADAGLVKCSEWIVTCGGTSRGLDTCVVLKPANTSRMLELRIGKIICMPSDCPNI